MYSPDEITDFFERSNDYNNLSLEKSMSNLFKVSSEDVKSALSSAFLMALIAVLGYIYALGSIFKINWHVLADIGVLATIPGVISVLKSWLTTSQGKFLGILKIR